MAKATAAAGPLRRLETNRAIEALLAERGDRALTADELAQVRQYTGYGGITDASTIGTAQMTEYYTPALLVRKMWALAQAYHRGPITSVLEPACGSGRFFECLPASATRVVGYDISAGAVAVAQALWGGRPGLTVEKQPFEALFFEGRRSIAAQRIADAQAGRGFDLVIGNPPYGTMQSLHAGMGEKAATHANSWDEYFITRSLDVLNPGGVLCFVVGGSVEAGSTLFLSREHRAGYHNALHAKGRLLDAYRLPQGIFLDTDVSTEILVFQKR